MDQRQTLKANESFAALLKEHMENGDEVRILFDSEGVERANGTIMEIDVEDGRLYVVLFGGIKIYIDSIIGLNGIFKDDYTEC